MGDSGQAGRGFQPDSDVHITLDDQQRINNFARCYAKHGDLLAELKAKENELKVLEDATEELALVDESEVIPFLEGEVFVCRNIDDTHDALNREKGKVAAEIKVLEESSKKLSNTLSRLKTQLYAKFGSHINLED